MSLTEIKKIIAKLQDEVIVERIGLSGGEPLTREDISQLLRYLDKRDIAPYLITNGALLTREIAEVLSQTQCVCEITLLSFRKEIHDKLAGRHGAREDAIRGFVNVNQAGLSPAAVFVATSMNFMDLYETAELAMALGATALAYNRLNLGAHNLPKNLTPTADMVRTNLDMLEDLGAKYGIPISVSVVIEPCVVDIRKYEHIHFGWCPLAGSESYFTIDPAGNVRVCNHSPTILGNLNIDNFKDIYFKHPHLKKFREEWPKECLECVSELRDVCRGGCKAAAEQCWGDMKHVDPFVSINRGMAEVVDGKLISK